jgi:hypothetical protein
MAISTKHRKTENASRRKDLFVFLLALVTIALAIPLLNHPAFAKGGYNYVALRTHPNIQSVYITGTGWTNSPQGPHVGNISACYTYSGFMNKNRGQWVKVGDGLNAHHVKPISSGDANPQFKDGSKARVFTYTSNNCSSGLESSIQAEVPTGQLNYWWLNLR